jgi:PAS domain-containing protein
VAGHGRDLDRARVCGITAELVEPSREGIARYREHRHARLLGSRPGGGKERRRNHDRDMGTPKAHRRDQPSPAPVPHAPVRWKNGLVAVGAQKPLELILARNLLTSISTPAFLVDAAGVLLFYNEAAGALLGLPFEEAGRMKPDEWGTRFGPVGADGDPIPFDRLPLTVALREGRPAHSNFRIHAADGEDRDIEVSAFPIAAEETSGAMAIFWPVDEPRADGEANR